MAIVAPASPFAREEFTRGVAEIERLGFVPVYDDTVFAREGYLAGSAEVRANSFMSDRQTSGGYPQIATVITADLPLAGQLAPGDWVEFARCTREEAIAALRDQEAMFGGLA